ncbi:hypothetical protein [Pollutibacter soli]|uniref:hypothetical protein n=1 Tax=Pollutibacter soli TaxID=3034157 RepID=UPI0030134A0E
MNVYLFGQQEARLTFNQLIQKMTTEIHEKSNDYVVNVDSQEWKKYFIDKYEFTPIEVFPEQINSVYKGKTKAIIQQFGVKVEREVYNFEVKIPFTGSSFLFLLKPSICHLNYPQVEIPDGNSGFITGKIDLIEQDANKFEYLREDLVNAIIANIPNINKDVTEFNLRIRTNFDNEFLKKKESALQEQKFFETLNIDIDRTTETILKISFDEKKKIPEPIIDKKTNKKYNANNPILDDKFYEDVLETINTFFKSVEKKPSIYKTKDEEALRDYVLPILETRYLNSTITGETFNKGGKTDILVKYKDNTNLFVAECKFWKGEMLFHETINQLFDRYLTWRDSKVAIIFFVTNREFSKVLSTINNSVKTHPYFVRENGSHGESSFSYLFHFPDDKGKYIQTEIMSFHFPT